MQLFVNLYPNSTRIPEANAAIDKLWLKLEVKDFNAAMSYYDREEYKAAATCFSNLIEDYPTSDLIETMQFMSVKSLYELAIHSTERKRMERYRHVVTACGEFTETYPTSTHSRDIAQMNEKSQQVINSTILP